LKIRYISYGKYITGGFLHESFFANALAQELKKNQPQTEFTLHRFKRYFKGFLAHVKLQFLTYSLLNSEIAILVGRMAWMAILKQLFNKSFRAFVVLHHIDNRIPSSVFFKLYTRSFLCFLNQFKIKRVSIVVVSPFWLTEVKKRYPQIVVHYFPNLFDPLIYQTLQSSYKSKSIHLGQWSWKNDPKVLELAQQLSEMGYFCYFSTNQANEQAKHEFYEIIHEPQSAYLKRMAAAQFTLALTVYQEGWNRVAHESILLGTAVIGYPNGGLRNLLEFSGAYVVNSIEEVLPIIKANSDVDFKANSSFIETFNSNQSGLYLEPILHFLNQNRA
jgi:hypothetical protein